MPGPYYGGGGGGSPDEDDEDEDEDHEEEDEGRCWKYLTAIPSARVSGKFGEERKSGPHKGLDIAVPTGTAVYAARSGVVDGIREDEPIYPKKDDKSPEALKARKSATGTGNYVKIIYSDGEVGRYLHLKQGGIWIDEGQSVSAGDNIAQSNATGRDITGPHLHYDHHDGSDYVDPQEELDECE